MPKHQTRSDALAHRALLLDAADQVFSEYGVHVALELVTARAGVSRATLYRNFPDRAALMEALLERSFHTLESEAQQFHAREDGLFLMLGHLAELIATSAPVSDYWRATDRENPALVAAQKRLTRLMSPLLKRAISADICRADLTTKDLVLASGMLGSCLRGRTNGERRRLSKRALDFLLGGLRSQGRPQRLSV